MSTLAILKRGLKRLETRGWWQGSAYEKSQTRGKLCAFAAIDFNHSAAGAIEKTLEHNSLVGWNDSKDRTKRQVLSAFRRTIKRLEKERNA